MTKKWRDFGALLKRESLLIRTFLVGMAFGLLSFGAAFPRYLFTGDCVRVFDESGEDVTEKEREKRNLYRDIAEAGPERIEVKIGILEWAER